MCVDLLALRAAALERRLRLCDRRDNPRHGSIARLGVTVNSRLNGRRPPGQDRELLRRILESDESIPGIGAGYG